MKVRDLITRIERRAQNPITRSGLPNKYDILDHLDSEMRTLLDAESWSWSIIHANPIAKTDTGQRVYPLPRNFGINFIRGADDDGTRHLCKLSDGDGETFLEYKNPEQLFGSDFESASNAKPESYTITARSGGGLKQLTLDPPPDSNSDSHYTIRGAYRMAFDKLRMDDWIPNEIVTYLMFSCLIEIRPERQDFVNRFALSRSQLYLAEARNRSVQLIPTSGEEAGHDGWTGEFNG